MGTKPTQYRLPDAGYVRLKQLVGDDEIMGILPFKTTAWLTGIKKHGYPEPVKLGPGITAWRVEDIRAFLEDPEGWIATHQPRKQAPADLAQPPQVRQRRLAKA